jgi:hypothetical protein
VQLLKLQFFYTCVTTKILPVGLIMWQDPKGIGIVSGRFQLFKDNNLSLNNKTTNVMRLGAFVFIIPWKALYMFRVIGSVLHAPDS